MTTGSTDNVRRLPVKRYRPREISATLVDGAPLRNAETFVVLRYQHEGVRTLRHYRGAFYAWTGTHWREKSDDELEAELYDFLGRAQIQRGREVADYNPTRGKVAEIVHALRRVLYLSDEHEMPGWLDGSSKGPPAGDLVACRNGILNLLTRKLVPHHPAYFGATCLPLDYDPHAPKPREWLRFLRELWPGDEVPPERLTLQEMVGYLLTADTRQQKAFLIVGPKRAGKGTIIHVLTSLIGERNVVSITLKSLTGEFGRWPLIDKQVAVVPDARLSTRADASAVAEHLLSISGGDKQTINRKNRSHWHGYLGVRFVLATNEMPAITDASGTLPSRFVPLRLKESFFGREDMGLKDKLGKELPGILNWALDGLDRMTKRGHFEPPQSSREMVREMEDLASPVAAFVREECVTYVDAKDSEEFFESVKTLYSAFKRWAENNQYRRLDAAMFGKNLRALLPKLRTKNGGTMRTYVGIALRVSEDDDS
jgi:putative DNA primase/helicase